ncbi:HNH endonuclease [Clostridium sp. MT-14]|uniref:HNH endonuclease n=1 Tax=Clostridium sp. MT-14 TaxID=3348360 RepID=UPI0035F4778F
MKWNPNNKRWYESKGYKWTKNGDEFDVKVEDLSKGSNAKVQVQCDNPNCDCTKFISWKIYKKLNNDKYYCYNCTHVIYTYDEVKRDYLQQGFILLENKYTTIDKPMKCICKKHKNIIQYKSFRMILNKRMCFYCQHELQRKEGHPSWKGGITPINESIRHSDEYINWRRLVFERDNYTCQCCKNSLSNNLEAHHIENFSDHENLRFDINNGITLCKKCHNPNQKGSFHNIYGNYNNTEEQLKEYIKNHRKRIQKHSKR